MIARALRGARAAHGARAVAGARAARWFTALYLMLWAARAVS
jgi:hypothetical protein